MIYQDDRTAEQKRTHTVIVAMTDRFMSGWGLARGGVSYCGWAVKPEDAGAMEKRVRSRGDALRVRVVGSDWRPRGAGHCHIYVGGDL